MSAPNPETLAERDARLLAEYVATRSDAAFRALAEAHGPMVHGVCRRSLGGDVHGAEDAAQAVFLMLSRRAGDVRDGRRLGAWLFRTARAVVLNLKREAARRRRREESAARARRKEETVTADEKFRRDVHPVLDEAIASLRETQQSAVVMRFLGGRSHAEVGASLGCSPEAAKERVLEGLRKMRVFMARRGVVVTSAALVAGLSALEAPALAAATTASAPAAALAQATLKALFWGKVKAAVAAVALTMAAAGGAGAALLSSPAPGPAPVVEAPPPQEPPPGAPLRYTVGWLGQTWAGGPHPQKWFQGQLGDVAVQGDRVYGVSHTWDEHGGEASIYTAGGDKVRSLEGWHSWGYRGGPAVAADATHVFFSMGHDPGDGGGEDYGGVARYTLEGKPAEWPGAKNKFRLAVNGSHKKAPTGLAVADGELFVSDPSADRIRVYKTADMAPVRDVPFKNPGRLLADKGPERALWIIDTGAKAVRKIGRNGEDLKVSVTDCREPVAICLDAKGNLLVADNDVDRKQVRAYSARDGSHLGGADFGAPVYSGPKPGAVGLGRFYDIRGIATDAEGNLYVAEWMSKLHKIDAARKSVLWTLRCLEFVSVGDPDPADDTSIYSSCYRYRIDYGKAPGKNWTEEAITVDPKRYPHDPRLQDLWIFTRVVRWKGQRIMYGRRQIGPETWFWRFDGEIAVPAAMVYPHGARKGEWPPGHPDGPFLWVDANGDGSIQAEEYQKVAVRRGINGICVDDAGDIWLSDYYVKDGPSMTRIPFGGLNKGGAPTWDLAKASVVPVPTVAGDQLICKWTYDPARDRMYLGMFTQKRPHPTWPKANSWEQCSVGPVIRCWADWSKKPRLLWESEGNGFEGSSLGGKPVTQHKGWSVEGEHLFATYTRLQEQIAVDVYRTSDGKFLGTLLPSEEVGPTGWVDGNDAVQSHRRADGTYVILVEECWMGKNLVFLWRPGGGGTGTTPARPPGRRN